MFYYCSLVLFTWHPLLVSWFELPFITLKKKIKFSSYIGILEWSSCKVIYEEGLPNI